jgi:ATP synthase protein I
MSDTTDHSKGHNQDFPKQVSSRERRKLKARKQDSSGAWFGLGMFGIVGWSVAIPTVGGIFMGIWIDVTWPSSYSWTLMLLLVGLVIGCYNAWYWVQKERKAIANDLKKGNNEH